jgi:phage tail sheath protein FI
MAETLISPGVLARENDLSQVTQQPITVGAAIVGPTVKGPVNIPTLVTSYSDYSSKFGTSFVSGGDFYSYLTSIAAYNYFQAGGETLLITRVVNGTYTPATASIVGSGSITSFALETLSKGAIMNSFSAEVSGTLPSGSTDNIRWEIAAANTGSGTFSLLVRRGDDSTNNKVILETWNNLSLDPKQPNYIAAVIGDQTQNFNSNTTQIETTGSYPNASRYVRVKAVNNPTPDYFDNTGTAKATFTENIPVIGSGSVGGAAGTLGANAKFYDQISLANTQGLSGSDYTNVLALLGNKDDYQFNVLVTPGIYRADYAGITSLAASECQDRGDAIYVADLVAYGAAQTAVLTQAASIDNSYTATYWPWLQVSDPDTGKLVWVPASTLIPAVYAYNDRVGAEWFAPAGINRGGLGTVLRAERKLASSDRDTHYSANVNPIASFPNTGVVVYGQKTLQKKASATDRVNVRRLLINLKSYISQVSQTLVFEQNTTATRNNFLAQVNPYLQSVQQRQGLYAFRVVMDDTNNTADVIDRNQLVGAIYIQPTKTAEFIILDFNILPTGATFPA